MRTEPEATLARRDTKSLDAFSQIHLATAVERAVYRCFVSDPHACWSDAEAAFASRMDLSTVSWAFERFADAGIVEMVEEGCYRWRPELRYVLERVEPEAERCDPVCGMPVAADAPLRTEDVFGRTERFCSKRCMVEFRLRPLLFTRPPDAHVERSMVEDDHGP